MKAFVTAQLTNESINVLEEHLTLTFGGWGYGGQKLDPQQLVEQAKDCEVLIICYEDINEYVLENLPKLQYIMCTRGGVENIDLAAIKKHNVTLSNTPGRNASAVADVTMGLMIGVARHIPQTHQYIKEKRWDKVSWDIAGNTPFKRFSGFELEGKKLGIVGFGAIGQKVAKRAAGFDMEIIAFDPYYQGDKLNSNVTFVDFVTLVKESDFISLHCKYTADTKELMNNDVFALMKESAYIINTARGGLINEQDLTEALKTNTIAGAALDALVNEPINPDHPFLDLENIVITPHIGGASNDIISHQSRMVVTDVLNFIKGRSLLYALS